MARSAPGSKLSAREVRGGRSIGFIAAGKFMRRLVVAVVSGKNSAMGSSSRSFSICPLGWPQQGRAAQIQRIIGEEQNEQNNRNLAITDIS